MVNEKKLFEALNKAFANSHSLATVRCNVIHGSRSFVSFNEILGSSFFYSKDHKHTVKCELADLLIICINKQEMRICCLQNKYEQKATYKKITDSFKVDMRQYYLLNKRPFFQKSGYNNGLLYDAICPSVGAYGVFYKDVHGYNMNYHSANVLHERTLGACGRHRNVLMDSGVGRHAFYTGSTTVEEWQFAEDLNEFGDAVENMLIGSPFSHAKGLGLIGDFAVLDAVATIIDMDMTKKNELRQSIANSSHSISFRAAVIIRGRD